MREIKSAMELAMKKVGEMEKLSPEELAKIRKREQVSLGRALATRCVEDEGYRLADLKAAIGNCEEGMRGVVIRAFISQVSEAIGLENYERPLRTVLALFRSFPGDEDAEVISRKIESVCHGYQEAKEKVMGELRERLLGKLEKEGIWGSAIEVAEAESGALNELRSKFTSELEYWKQKLGKLV
jgi:hypothetical protein